MHGRVVVLPFYVEKNLKGTMSTTMHCALKQCLAAILLAE
jgi:hypothetical protein